jgi:hypothetical protein
MKQGVPDKLVVGVSWLRNLQTFREPEFIRHWLLLWSGIVQSVTCNYDQHAFAYKHFLSASRLCTSVYLCAQ